MIIKVTIAHDEHACAVERNVSCEEGQIMEIMETVKLCLVGLTFHEGTIKQAFTEMGEE